MLPLPNEPQYQGDVSTWGRKHYPSYYRQDGSESQYTMSSGLSPRDDDAERRPMDVDQAKSALAYNAGLFGAAQRMRRQGKAPKTFGIADDLPDRIAYNQLEQLSGMARKVRVFERHTLGAAARAGELVTAVWPWRRQAWWPSQTRWRQGPGEAGQMVGAEAGARQGQGRVALERKILLVPMWRDWFGTRGLHKGSV
eukprot:365146-Chlamydomonas_euryale.AAC.1